MDAGGFAGMTAPHLSEYETWPGHGPEPSGRRPAPRLLAVLAGVYDCAVTELIDLADRERLPAADLLVLDKYGQGEPGAAAAVAPRSWPAGVRGTVPGADGAGAGLAGIAALDIARYLAPSAWPASPPFAYGGWQEPFVSGSLIRREVEMAAHDGNEYAGRAERRDIGDATLEQFRADVVRLSHEYTTGEPFPLFAEMRRVRDRMHAALDRRLWPRDEADLYFLLGCLNCLMAAAADDLGCPHASEELIRAGWAYAVVIDHKPLMACLRADLANVAYWRDRPRQSRDFAESGLRYLAGGRIAAELHLKHARAAAALGDADVARRAIGAAWDARELREDEDLVEIGGQFGLSRASQHSYVGSVLLEIPGAGRDAAVELERATGLYAAGPRADEDYGFEIRMRTHIDLAMARLRAGDLDGAEPALRPVLALPPAQRINPLPQRLERVRAELTQSSYHGSPQASDLAGKIEDFGRDTIAGVLSALPG